MQALANAHLHVQRTLEETAALVLSYMAFFGSPDKLHSIFDGEAKVKAIANVDSTPDTTYTINGGEHTE